MEGPSLMLGLVDTQTSLQLGVSIWHVFLEITFFKPTFYMACCYGRV